MRPKRFNKWDFKTAKGSNKWDCKGSISGFKVKSTGCKVKDMSGGGGGGVKLKI